MSIGYVTGVLPVLYQDRHLVVVDKPAGLPTIAPRGGGANVADALGLLVCHRLDADTSGALVLARSAAGQRMVSVAFESRRVRKGYLAIGRGALPDTGQCTVPLGEWQRGRVHIGRGRESDTAWTVRARHDADVLVEAFPRTGRTHQVRAHLSVSGAPLLGDEAYGGPAGFPLALHAWWIELPWPGVGDVLRVRAPVPAAFEASWGAPLGALEPSP